MRSHKRLWVVAGVFALLALVAVGVRDLVGGDENALGPARRATRDSIVSEMMGALDLDPRLRRPETRRLVESVAVFCDDPATTSAETLYALGLRRYYGEFDTAGAEAAFSQAHEARPGWAWPLNGLGIVQFVSGRREEAMTSFGEAMRLAPTWSRPHADLAILYRRAGEVGDALTEAELALRIEPDHPINRYNYGVILDGMGRHVEARAQYLAALEVAPDLAQAQYNLACSFGREGDVAGALGPLGRAFELEPAFRIDAEDDPDFDPIRRSAGFRALLGSRSELER